MLRRYNSQPIGVTRDLTAQFAIKRDMTNYYRPVKVEQPLNKVKTGCPGCTIQ